MTIANVNYKYNKSKMNALFKIVDLRCFNEALPDGMSMMK